MITLFLVVAGLTLQQLLIVDSRKSKDTRLHYSNDTQVIVDDMSNDETLGPPASKPVNCHRPHCKEFLSRADEIRMKSCLLEVVKRNEDFQVFDNDCNFMNGEGRSPVALASAEGSGNTWVRGLLERATGICTGFNFCDYVMRMKGFIGDNINSGNVLVVKTHTVYPQWTELNNYKYNRLEARYGSAIFLLRNPYDSLIAEWNRRLTNGVMRKRHLPHEESHVNRVPREIWCKYVH